MAISFEAFLEVRHEKGSRGRAYCVEPGKGRVPCPPGTPGVPDKKAKTPAKKPAAKKPPAPKKDPAANLAAARQAVLDAKAGSLSREDLKAALAKLTGPQLDQLKREFKVRRAGSTKAGKQDALVGHATGQHSTPAAPRKTPQPKAKPPKAPAHDPAALKQHLDDMMSQSADEADIRQRAAAARRAIDEAAAALSKEEFRDWCEKFIGHRLAGGRYTKRELADWAHGNVSSAENGAEWRLEDRLEAARKARAQKAADMLREQQQRAAARAKAAGSHGDAWGHRHELYAVSDQGEGAVKAVAAKAHALAEDAAKYLPLNEFQKWVSDATQGQLNGAYHATPDELLAAYKEYIDWHAETALGLDEAKRVRNASPPSAPAGQRDYGTRPGFRMPTEPMDGILAHFEPGDAKTNARQIRLRYLETTLDGAGAPRVVRWATKGNPKALMDLAKEFGVPTEANGKPRDVNQVHDELVAKMRAEQREKIAGVSVEKAAEKRTRRG